MESQAVCFQDFTSTRKQVELKHSTAKSILKSLQNERLESFLSLIGQGSNGKLLEKICRFLLASLELTEAEVMRQFKLTRGQYFHWMDTIAEALTHYIARDGKVAYLGQCYEFARSLITVSDFEATTELLQAASQEALSVEEFDFVIRFGELAREIEPRPVLPMQVEEAIRCKENLVAYQRLFHSHERQKSIPEFAKRMEFMQAGLTNDLLNGKQPPLSKRANFLYLKVRASILVQLRQFSSALEFQTTLLAHIESNPWISDFEDLAFIQELSRYSQLLYLTGNMEQYGETSQRIQFLSFKNPKAESERIRNLYPYCIGIGIELGNQAAIVTSINGFLKLLEDSGPRLERSFITLNLYTCLYGAIASNNSELRRKLIRLLSKYRKADFSPRYYTMYRFLEVINAVEEGEWDDAKRLIANRLKRNEDDILPRITEALRFLAYFITLIESGVGQQTYVFPEELRQLLESLMQDSIFVGYFDTQAWVESKERRCPMLDIFRERASPTPSS